MKILIIEDDSIIVENIELTLNVGWPEAELIWTGLGEEGIELVESQSPDLVILDLGLPDINGFEVLKSIRLFSNIPVVVLTVREEETSVVRAFEYGADEYLNKPFRQMELVARLKSLAKRKSSTNLEDEKCGPFLFSFSEQIVKYGKITINLSRIEMLILHHLAINQGKTVTYASIARTIWPSDYPGYKNAIRVFIRQLREKIEKDPGNPQIILNKPRLGYLIPKDI